MEPQQAKLHLEILNKRVETLRCELEAALKDSKITDERYKNLQDGLNMILTNRKERFETIEAKYGAEIEDFKKQINLADEMLKKKKEERQTLLDYLSRSELSSLDPDDLRNFDWETVKRLSKTSHQKKADILERKKEADILSELNQRAQQRLQELSQLIASTQIFKDRLTTSLSERRLHLRGLSKIQELQTKRISRIQAENERLNLLIKQCISSNEPVSDFVTKNVHAKCHAFIDCDNPQELRNGLMKFKTRQERIIKVLKYKENKLGRETNKLQVAKDQTHDQRVL